MRIQGTKKAKFLYKKTYVQIPGPPPIKKIRKDQSPWNYNSSKFISTHQILGRRLTPSIIVYFPENQNLKLFGEIKNIHFSSNFCKKLNFILTTIKHNFQSYSWWKDIIISVKLFFFFLIGIPSATTKHWVTRNRSTKTLQHIESLFRKNLQL